MKKHYNSLGLKEGASQEEINTAYDKLSKELNPSNNDNQEFFEEEYKKVQEAYKALSNSSILATEKGSKSHKSQDLDLKQKESLNDQPPKIKSKTSKRDYAFGGLLFFIATGIWGVFLQNMGFFVPSNDYTQKVRVVNTVDVDGSVRVDGGYITTEVDGTVDVNLDQLRGYTPWVNVENGNAVLGIY
ncbi:MAG: DnaJ domain-containing protein, partial [Flavobacteriaceae bacterium]|nr:DnaJ domain-containing protein [Flavobacteriaceae bacterium]